MSVSFNPAQVQLSSVDTRAPPPPLCVDLDETLVLSSLLYESLIRLIKHNPFNLIIITWWLIRGRAVLQAEVSARITLDPALLPYHREFICWLESERTSGRSLWLYAAGNELIAGQVADHLRIFEGVVTGNRGVSPSREMKASRLVERFGEGGFDYCGRHQRDFDVWKRARGVIVVQCSRRSSRHAGRYANVLRAFPRPVNCLQAIIRAIRPHQWTKNVLILVPMLAAHRADEPATSVAAILAVGAFCLCASSVYILNDLMDLDADRTHVRKSKRPFAAGDLSLLTGFVLVPILLGAAALLGALLPGKFQLVLAAYYALTVAYSFVLKRLVLIDALALAGLYTTRIIAGAAALNLPLSLWLLTFAVFLFLSLAFVKRFAELDALRRQQRLRAAGRGYNVEDLPILQSLGSAAGYLSVVVLALYINSPEIEKLYRRPMVIWILCVLMLYWISRVWMTAQRGGMHDDPVVFALKDRVSLGVGLLAAITVALAI